MTMTKDEALKLALSTLTEVRQETFRLSRDGQKLYAEEKVWSTIISIKEVLAQPQRTWVGLTDEEIWKFWWSRPEVPEGEDDSMEAEFVAAVRAVLAAHNIKE